MDVLLNDKHWTLLQCIIPLLLLSLQNTYTKNKVGPPTPRLPDEELELSELLSVAALMLWLHMMDFSFNFCHSRQLPSASWL